MMDYCPHCRSIQGLIEKFTFRYEEDRLIIISTYHCAQCHSFIKSEVDNGADRKGTLEKYLEGEE